jgi:hypothetical protein
MTLSLTILKVLSLIPSPRLLPKETLAAEVRLRDATHTLADIEAAMKQLEDGGHISGVVNADAPGGSRWKINDAGKLRLNDAGL